MSDCLLVYKSTCRKVAKLTRLVCDFRRRGVKRAGEIGSLAARPDRAEFCRKGFALTVGRAVLAWPYTPITGDRDPAHNLTS
jgi:hypothetical protein